MADLGELEAGYFSDGTPIARDADGTLWTSYMLFGKSDMEVSTVQWGVTSYNAAEEMCGSCDANRTDKPFTNLRENSEWRPSEKMSNVQYMSRVKQNHPLTRSRYFGKHFNRFATMHVSDLKGVCAIAAGSLMHGLVRREARLGANQELRMAAINDFIMDEYKTTIVSSRVPALTIDNVSGGTLDQHPHLHGPLIKAANTRPLMPIMEKLARKYHDSGSVFDKAVIQVFSHMCGFYAVMYAGGVFFTKEQLAQYRMHILTVGKYWMLLRDMSRMDECMEWYITPKVHAFQHLAYQAELINPRYVQNDAEESLIGVLTRIYHNSANGPYKRTVQKVVLYKYFLYMVLLFNL